jgi:hypothetical protein
MDGYYGPAAAPMKAFYDMLEKAMMDEKESMQLSNNSSRRSYLNMDFLSRCRDVLLKAEAAAAPGTPERIHVWREIIVIYNCILNQWDRMKRQNVREFAFPKAETLEKYAQMREAVIMYWWREDAEHPFDKGRKRRTVLREDLKKEMECLSVSFPLPERFKNLSSEDVIDLPYVKLSWSKEDPEATGGKAVYFNLKDRAPYREKEPAPTFFLYDGPSKRSGPTLEIKDIPTDEKYHLYKMGLFALGRDTIICGHWSWIMNCAWLAPQYVNADGMKDNPNEWDVYISVKVTGPVYVPGSTNENALWLDRVILVKPVK